MLTNENYFSTENQMKYCSSSQLKAFLKCEAAALAEASGNYEREQTTALLVGSYVDAHFEGTLDIFKAHHPELFKRDGTLKADYSKAEYIISRIEQDEFFMSFMDGEKQKIMTGEISGVPVKIKIDSYFPDKIVDLKIMKDFSPVYRPEEGKLTFIEAWGYDLQGALYQEIVRQNTGKKLPFFIAAASKENEPDLGVFEIPQELLDFELDKAKEVLPRIDAIKRSLIEPERCERCEYCRATKVLHKVMTMEELKIDYTD